MLFLSRDVVFLVRRQSAAAFSSYFAKHCDGACWWRMDGTRRVSRKERPVQR